MLKWLKESLFGKPDIPAPSCILQIKWGGRITEAHASSIRGAHILCHLDDGSFLIGESQAVDPEHFRRLWAHLGGSKAVWEDGTPYSP